MLGRSADSGSALVSDISIQIPENEGPVLQVINKLLPKKALYLSLACSGGRDSMVALRYLSNGRAVRPLFFNHGTSASAEARAFLAASPETRYTMCSPSLLEPTPAGVSQEAWWRECRYQWLEKMATALRQPIVTAHHLDDAVETYLMWSLRGAPKLPQLIRKQGEVFIIKPFLLCSRATITQYAHTKGVQYLDDPSNEDLKYDRNYCRHQLMPHVLRLSPGIRKVVKKMILKQVQELDSNPVYQEYISQWSV